MLLLIFLLYKYEKKISIYNQKNKQRLLEKAKQYYKNNKERLQEQARNKYRELSNKEKA